ncbi:MAG: hypothetical protein AAB672_02430 [Patescibacteria group bacterium]
MTTIIIFASSLFVALAFVSIKAIELKYGRKNIILELVGKFDHQCDYCVSGLKFRCLQFVQTIRYILFVQLKEIIKHFWSQIHERIKHEYKIRQEIIMGRKEIINNGSASFYLKKITEHKGNGEKGKIHEENM